MNNSQSAAIRSAINQDLKQLLSVAGVDQNAVMQKLSQLANTVDELPVLDVNFGDDKMQQNYQIPCLTGRKMQKKVRPHS